MSIWFVGLRTSSSAERATKWGGFAAILAAVWQSAGIIFSQNFFPAGKPLDEAIVWLIGASLVPGFLGWAGLRLLKHLGWLSGGIAAIFLAADIALKSSVVSRSLELLLFLLVSNGIRGVFARRQARAQVQDTFK